MVERSLGLALPLAVSGPVLVDGDSVYFGRGCLEEAAAHCLRCGLVILGMEGIATDGAIITPTIEFIADLSDITGPWRSRVQESYEAAMRIIAQWKEMPGYQFVDLTVAEEY